MPVGLIGLGTSFIIWVNYRENRERVRAGAVRMRSGLRFPFIPENTALRIQAGVLLVSGLFLIYRNSMPKWIPIGEILYGLIVFVWVSDREKRAARKRAQ